MTHLNADLGLDTDLIALVSKIRDFDYDNATPPESMALARALKVVADDIVDRFRKFLRVTFDDAHFRENLAFIEAQILREPAQYLWVHQRFKTRPPGEPSLYR